MRKPLLSAGLFNALIGGLIGGLAATAAAFDRYDVLPGDTVTAEALRPGDADEFVIDLALGTRVTWSVGGQAPGNFVPTLGFFSEGYESLLGPLQFVGGGRPGGRSVTITNAAPIAASGRYRFLIQAGQIAENVFSLGSYRVRNVVRPGRKFALNGSGDDPDAPTTLDFGAYPGYEASVRIRARGGTVTIRSLTDPEGNELEAPAAKRRRWRLGKRRSRQPGFAIETFGDHRLELEVPEGTKRWTAVVTVTGRLPPGTQRDVRAPGPAEPPGVQLGVVTFAPAIQITTEQGGPNDFLLTAFRATLPDDGGTLGLPAGNFIDPRAPNPANPACTRDALSGGLTPHAYRLTCPNGLFADIVDVERDEAGDIVSFSAPDIRSPLGSGSATLSDFTYTPGGLPSGWTEVRRYDRTGNRHTLVVRDIEYFPNSVVRAYAVDHTDPSGTTRTYHHVPFQLR